MLYVSDELTFPGTVAITLDLDAIDKAANHD